MPEQLVTQVQHTLAALADPARAVAMHDYLREQFPFLGIPTPARRAALKPLLKVDFDQQRLLTVADRLGCLSANTAMPPSTCWPATSGGWI